MTRLAFVLVVTAALARPASADLINPGFEAGNLTGWAAAGDASVVTAGVGVPPREGAFQALLTTASANGDANNFSGADAVSAADLRTFLGLSGATIPTASEGSAVRQTFAAAAGDVLSFRYKFLTAEGSNPDFAFATVNGVVVPLADTTLGPFSPSLVVLDPVFGDPTTETAWRTFSFTVPTTGVYTLGIGVADAGDEFIPSGLLIDDARVGPARTSAAVPAPGSAAALIAAVCLGLFRPTRSRRTRRPG